MDKQKTRLAEAMVKATTAYELNQIDFRVEPDGDLKVWSVEGFSGTFHGTSIIGALDLFFSMYLDYNEDMKRVELRIF